MVAFDSTILSVLLFPDADLRHGDQGSTVENARERVLGLVRELDETKEQVIVPAPALAEVLVAPGADTQEVPTTLRGSAYIRIGAFDERAAVELALRLRSAMTGGDPREGLRISKAEMKLDRQIVAIALVGGARVLYSDNEGVKKFAEGCGLSVKRVADLRVPAEQQLLFETPPGAADAPAAERSGPGDGGRPSP